VRIGRERPTLEKVAARAGVSRATASRVINGSPTVAPHIRDAVTRAVQALGYVPNLAARTLVTQRTDSYALVVPEPTNRVFSDDQFFPGIIRGVSQELEAADRQLVLMLASSSTSHDRVERYAMAGHVDGVMFASMHGADPLPSTLARMGIPIVCSERPLGRSDLPHVGVDNVGGATAATRHLVESGRKRIATIAGPQDMPAGQDRLRGWTEALAAHGLPNGPELIAYGDFDRGSGARAMEELLGREVEFDGLFVASDLMALDALAVLREHALRVPDDVAVVGFDDSVAATQARPALTTVRQPVEEMAKALTLTLLDRIGDPDAPITSRVFPPKLVPRAST
jgi:DNA-binding LacI/PurR family transcriptional regulator